MCSSQTKACFHNRQQPGGLLLLAIGNTLRADDGVAQILCAALPEQIKQQLCYVDLGPYTSLITSCLRSHQAAILVDSITSNNTPGSHLILDLTKILAQPDPINLNCSHGFSFVDELKLAHKTCCLPPLITFFGIEIQDTSWGEGLSKPLQAAIPSLVSSLVNQINLHLQQLSGKELDISYDLAPKYRQEQ